MPEVPLTLTVDAFACFLCRGLSSLGDPPVCYATTNPLLYWGTRQPTPWRVASLVWKSDT